MIQRQRKLYTIRAGTITFYLCDSPPELFTCLGEVVYAITMELSGTYQWISFE